MTETYRNINVREAGDWRHMEREAFRATVSDVEIPWRAETTREQQEIERGLSLAGENEQGIQTREESSVI